MRRRVVILGGGVAGLAAAHELSRTERARATWDVEVVEMGHRLGGRLASAHRPESSGRNEEHGLHVWFGFYDNTFRLAEEVWEAFRKPEGCPWQSIWDAVRPIHVSDHGLIDSDRYHVRRVLHPRNSDRPGEAHTRSWAGRVTGWIDMWRSLPLTLVSILRDVSANPIRLPDAVSSAIWPTPAQEAVIRGAEGVLAPVLERIARLVTPETGEGRRRAGGLVERLLARLHRRAVDGARAVAGADPGAQELLRVLDLLLAIARGVASPEHGIAEDGDLDRISAWELGAWLKHHGAEESTIARSRFLETLYDVPFGYLRGDRSRPVLEASTAVRFSIRILVGYKHAVAYLLSGGAGETLVAPLFDVLRDRGVRFRFFHRLSRVEVDEGRGRLSRLTFVRAARPRGEYRHLVERRGLRGFRADPDWSGLEDGEALRDRGVDFYSRFADRGETDEVSMEVGRDFDDVILALPLGSIIPDPDGHTPVAAWLDVHPPARACLERLHLVPTVAAQLWFREPAEAIGLKDRAIVAWAPPYSVMCDMSPVIAHEDWLAPRPASCAYLCGAWPLGASSAPSTDRGAKARDLAAARAALAEQLERHGASVLRGAPVRNAPAGHAPAGYGGPLVAQYVRVNVEPWDLADLALPGADAVRLEASDSGLDNLALAGAWVRTAMNTTSVEAAVSSGIAAARALGAEVRPILSEGWLRKPSCRPVLPGRALKEDANAQR